MYLASRQSFVNTQMFLEHDEYRKLDTNLTVNEPRKWGHGQVTDMYTPKIKAWTKYSWSIMSGYWETDLITQTWCRSFNKVSSPWKWDQGHVTNTHHNEYMDQETNFDIFGMLNDKSTMMLQ